MAVFLDVLGVLALVMVVVLGFWLYRLLSTPKHVAPPGQVGDDGIPRRRALEAGRQYYEVSRDSTNLLREMLSAEALSITIFPSEDARKRATRLVDRFDNI